MDLSKYTQSELKILRQQLNLTLDELEVFNFLTKSRSISEIAQTLKMSESTVSRKIKKIKDKIEKNTVTPQTVPIWEKVTLTPKEAAEYSNIGINKIEELLKNPTCQFVLYIGRKKLVKRKEFERYIEKTLEI